jgi:hypothetical protein
LFYVVTDRFAAISINRQDDELPGLLAKMSAHYTRAFMDFASMTPKTD